jgi:ferrochelatase
MNQLANLLSIDIGKIDFQICYQSKVGPLRWTTPSLGDEIKRIAKDNKNPLIIPIAFVSDHSETLVELDIEYKHLADELGITLGYAAMRNIDKLEDRMNRGKIQGSGDNR